MELFEKTIASDMKFEGKILSLRVDTVTLPDGRETKREIIGHHGGVGIVAVTDENEIILVRQFRAGTHDVTLEIPAGKLEKGENPRLCGIRELKEEVGAEASEFIYLGCLYPTVAYDTEIIYMYMAKGLSFSGQKLDEGEFLDLKKIPLEKAYEIGQKF